MTTFISVTCWKCKEVSGLSEDTHAVLRRSGQSFYCPWGHTGAYPLGESEEGKLRRERDRLRQNAAYQESRIADLTAQRDTESRRAAAARGQVTKLKKRAANGVCPCCNRSFSDLRRHMASKHAGFVAEEVVEVVGE